MRGRTHARRMTIKGPILVDLLQCIVQICCINGAAVFYSKENCICHCYRLMNKFALSTLYKRQYQHITDKTSSLSQNLRNTVRAECHKTCGIRHKACGICEETHYLPGSAWHHSCLQSNQFNCELNVGITQLVALANKLIASKGYMYALYASKRQISTTWVIPQLLHA
eukprot:1275302-Amphidinium_carterae.1